MIIYWPRLWAIDQEVVAKLAEVDMIIADLDRANSRIAALEHRNVGLTLCLHFYRCNPFIQEILRAEIETTRGESGTTEWSAIKRIRGILLLIGLLFQCQGLGITNS